MAAQMQGQLPDISQKRKDVQKSFPWKRTLIPLIIFAALVILTVGTLSYLNVLPASWATIIGFFLVLVPTVISLIGPLMSRDNPVQVVEVHYSPPPAPVPPSQPSIQEGSSYRDISGFPPPTSVNAIQQRTQTVEDIYTQLSQPDITALVLTGIGGAGKVNPCRPGLRVRQKTTTIGYRYLSRYTSLADNQRKRDNG